MQGYNQILAITLYKGSIVAITDDGCIWQWLKRRGEWQWMKLTDTVKEPY